ncbi:MAG: DUF3579 domain-containing protein [Gammaproteobacteria bacterium]|nr:DUF3579 domain-containing protein [Gammaproteobacteria bacterium]MDH5594889.1 DUF3579 domain-containing protein [Gammaproteobacteria bacterium]
MAENFTGKIIIEGMTREGRKFRPSDWAERMCGALSTVGNDRRLKYSPMLQPVSINGIKCMIIDPVMEESHPDMYAYLLCFANENELNVIDNNKKRD